MIEIVLIWIVCGAIAAFKHKTIGDLFCDVVMRSCVFMLGPIGLLLAVFEGCDHF